MDLLLINPNERKQIYQDLGSLPAIEPPFWCGLLASYVRDHGFTVAILDAEAKNLSPLETARLVIDASPRLAAIMVQGAAPATSSTPKMVAASLLQEQLLHTGIGTVFCGIHPSALPVQTMTETGCDYVCQGEPFKTILGLLQGYPHRDIPRLWYWGPEKNVLSSQKGPDLLSEAELPSVAWDLLDMTKYRAHNWHCLGDLEKRSPYAVLYSSLGCPGHCDFCNINKMYLGDRPSIRYRSAKDVLAEIDLLWEYGVRNIKMMDELFTLNHPLVEHICDGIIERGYDLNIWAYGRVGTVNRELLAKMHRAGIRWLCYGFESVSEEVRRGVNKKTSQSVMAETVEMTRDAGIYIQANIMFGLPDDTLETMQETLEWAQAWNFEWCNFYCATAMPGSKLYQDTVENDPARLPKNWADYSQYSQGFMPLGSKHLSGVEVLKFRDNAFNQYFSRPAYLEMIERKFGHNAREHVKQMLEHHIPRRG